MRFHKPSPKSNLEKTFLDQIEKETPDKIKNLKTIDCNNKDSFEFILKKEHLEDFDENGQGLGINTWFQNYQKEALVSTAGIRGLQNPIYPWDSRYPLNFVGISLATMGKILVAQDNLIKNPKLAACEVRYNSKEYVEIIARLQAANGIKTYVTENYDPIPIFLASFIIFIYDLYGGEYVTSSHSISRKIATKDLNTQGSQYIPSESMLFLEKVKQILEETRLNGEFRFQFSALNSPNVDKLFLKKINNGLDVYVEYLKHGVATKTNIHFIENMQKRIVVECMGGSITRTIKTIVEKLGISNHFDLIHQEEDPFFHQIGKTIDNNNKFMDLSCDTTIMKADLKSMNIEVPVIDTIPYSKLLANYPVGTTILMADPDADRLVTAYIEDVQNIEKLKKMGLVFGRLDKKRILVIFTPNQSFLMIMDFQKKSLEKEDLWKKYNWFMLKTTASQRSWDEWARAQGIPVVNTPVGFKELADSMQQVEKKMTKDIDIEVKLKDVFGIEHNLGLNPRLLFAGEESGGMITGPSKLIKSNSGRMAISMREKSAGEAIIIASALSAWLEQEKLEITDYLNSIYEDNKIQSRFEIRIDQKFYDENEPDIKVLLEDKVKGMEIKTRNNSFFLSLALGVKDNIISLDNAKKILKQIFPDLNFEDLLEVKFCGDGTYFVFQNKTLEVRPSGTDALNKAYGYGSDQWECVKYAQELASYDGNRSSLHTELIPQDYYEKVESHAFELYTNYKENQ